MNERRETKAGSIKWFQLHWPRDESFFVGPKILSLRKTEHPKFAYSDAPNYVSLSMNVIKPSDIDLKYLVGLLNSKLIFFWLKLKGKKQGEQLQIDKAPLLDIPLYKTDDNDKNEAKIKTDIIRLVDLIIEINRRIEKANLESEKDLLKKQRLAYECQIDNLIYKLYGITEEEKKIIEESLE